jgi:hypothetical protein
MWKFKTSIAFERFYACNPFCFQLNHCYHHSFFLAGPNITWWFSEAMGVTTPVFVTLQNAQKHIIKC